MRMVIPLLGAPSPPPALAVWAGAASASPAPMGKGPPRPCQRAVLVPWPTASVSDGSSRSAVLARVPNPALRGSQVSGRGNRAAKLLFPSRGSPILLPPPPSARRHFVRSRCDTYNKSARISRERLRTPRYGAPAFHPLTPHRAAVLPMPTRLTAESRLRPTRFSTQPPVSTPKLPPPKSCTHARLSSLCEPSCVPRACVPPAPRSRGGTEKGLEQLSPGRGCSCVYSGIYCKTQAWV